MKLKLTLFIALLPLLTVAQGVKISGTPGQPSASSILEIESTTQGILPPRMTESERDAIAGPAVGLLIYNTTSGCLNVYQGSAWFEVCPTCIKPPTPTVGSNAPTCEGGNIELTASTIPDATYSWTGPGGFTSSEQNPTLTNVSSSQDGTYSVVATVNGCASTPASTYVGVNSVSHSSQVFSYTGSQQSFTVPSCIYSIDVAALGAQGASGGNPPSGSGACGGMASATLSVTPGEVLYVYVGGKPATYPSTAGGFNGGGNAGGGAGCAPGAGGGASDIRRGGTSLSDRILVAAGGAGGGSVSPARNGGSGGGENGSTGADGNSAGCGGKGATQSAGGAGGAGCYGGNGFDGGFGFGGNGGGCDGGGGGGGYYGGGGGSHTGGGGGSSWVTTSGSSNFNTQSGQGCNNGQVTIVW